MSFPKTSDELKSAGYKFLDFAECKKCGDSIEWYETPNGKKIPINPMERGSSEVVVHFDTCTG